MKIQAPLETKPTIFFPKLSFGSRKAWSKSDNVTRKQAVEKSDFDEFDLGIEDMMDAASTGALEDEASCGTASNSAQRFGGWDGVCGNGKPGALVEPAPMSSRSIIVTPRMEYSPRAVPQSPSLHFEGINSGSRSGSSTDHEDVKLSLSTRSEAWCCDGRQRESQKSEVQSHLQ